MQKKFKIRSVENLSSSKHQLVCVITHNCIKFLQNVALSKAVRQNCKENKRKFSLLPIDFSKTYSGKEITWLYGPALTDMPALQESLSKTKMFPNIMHVF